MNAWIDPDDDRIPWISTVCVSLLLMLSSFKSLDKEVHTQFSVIGYWWSKNHRHNSKCEQEFEINLQNGSASELNFLDPFLMADTRIEKDNESNDLPTSAPEIRHLSLVTPKPVSEDS